MKDLLKNAASLLEEKYAQKLKPHEDIRLGVVSEADQIILRALVGTQNRAHEFELKAEVPVVPAQIPVMPAQAGIQNSRQRMDASLRWHDKKSLDDAKEALTLLLLDFLDASLNEFFRHDRRAGFSLDFSKRRFDQTDIWVRQEYRDFEAEHLADELLLSADGKKHSKID